MIGAPENSHRESRGQHGAICEDRSSKTSTASGLGRIARARPYCGDGWSQ